MKGIILAGGTGSRLFPLTNVISKQLLPVYDKPLIFYSLSTLMQAGIRDILLISTPHDLEDFKKLLKDGHQFGVSISYKEQKSPDGLAQAFIIGEEFIDGNSVAMILGDNIFYGDGLEYLLKKATSSKGATVFGYRVENPSRFGVVEFGGEKKVISIEEKPEIPKSPYAVTGLYFYDNRVCNFAKTIIPSYRNELEITDINNLYLKENALSVELLGRGFAWFDTGTVESLQEAAEFVKIISCRQGIKISVPEEIAFDKGWISKESIVISADKYKNSPYGEYLLKVAGSSI